MNMAATICLKAYGTPEGVAKAWDVRGRKLYHGTDWRSAIDIARHGLDPARADNSGHSGKRPYFGEDRSRAVYTTLDRKAAEGYGESKDGEKFAVVHLLPDEGALKRTSVDQESVDNKGLKEGSKSFITEGRIAPGNVTGISFYKNYMGKSSVVRQWSNNGANALDRLERRMKAYGTSEGARKAWDTRGRGRKAAAAKPTPKQAEQAKTLYEALGNVITRAHKKLDMGEHMKDADTVAKKTFHLMKTVGSWLEAGSAIAGMHELIHRAVQHSSQVGPEFWNTLAWAHQHLAPVIQHVVSLAGIAGAAEMEASQYGQTGWQYGRGIAKSTGYIPAKTIAGFPSSGMGKHGTSKPHVSHSVKGPRVRRPNPSGHVGMNVRKPNLSIHHLESGKIPKLKADIGGEPMTGNMGHVHMEPNVWFHPPSLTKRNSKESLRIPTDDPGENNDKFMDKTQRDDPKTQEFRMKILKRSAPGGLPAQIPARTTLISPHSGTYMPTGTGMYGAAVAARSRRLGTANRRGMFVSFKNRGRI